MAGWLAIWLAGSPAGWLSGWLAHWLAGWLPGWLARWLAGRPSQKGSISMQSRWTERKPANPLPAFSLHPFCSFVYATPTTWNAYFSDHFHSVPSFLTSALLTSLPNRRSRCVCLDCFNTPHTELPLWDRFPNIFFKHVTSLAHILHRSPQVQ